jgi:hypothetical protein
LPHIVNVVREGSEEEADTSGFNIICSGEDATTTTFIYEFLRLVMNGSGDSQAKSIAKCFFSAALRMILRRDEGKFQKPEPPETTAGKILDASEAELLEALGLSILKIKAIHGTSVVIDGIDKVGPQGARFIGTYCSHMRKIGSNFRALITGQPDPNIKRIATGMLCIEYDEERKGVATPFSLAVGLSNLLL